MARTGSSAGSGRHFAPASLTRFGGFGEPGAEPVWKRLAASEADNLRSAQAQDQFVRRVRELIQIEGISETDLEAELGYKHRTLVRKFKGYEQLTLRDVLRIGDRFGSSVAAALIERNSGAAVAEGRPKSSGKRESSRAVIREAAERLLDAADLVEPSDSSLSEALSKAAELVLALGRR